MGAFAARGLIGWKTALRLGRVCNLPTVWSNVLAAMALGAVSVPSREAILAALAMSLLYVGGMYINDAFDRDIDARERPSRPIPSGEAPARTVFCLGFGLLAAGVGLLALLRPMAGLIGLVLAGAIVLYDWHHKGNVLSPVLMGLCRAFVYAGAAAVLAKAFWIPVMLGAAALFLYVTGLTLAAKQERLERVASFLPFVLVAAPLAIYAPAIVNTLPAALAAAALLVACLYAGFLLRRRGPGDVGSAVGLLIAAIALVDALAAASTGAVNVALLCAGFFALTLLLQRHVPGT